MPSRLIIRPGAIGDFILCLPAMESLAADCTEVWTTTRNVPLARFADRARSIADVGLDRLGITHADDVIERLRAFDSIISWYGANRPEFRELVRSLQLPFVFHDALPDGTRHAVDFFLDQAGHSGGAPHLECRVAIPSELAVLQPFASSPEKRWPHFDKLAAKLESRLRVNWCRGPDDVLPGAACIENLYQLGCWLATAAVYVGNDSGITHLAAAVGTPVVAIFQNTDPAVWAPRGRRVEVLVRPDVDTVMAAVSSLINPEDAPAMGQRY
jgi:heptosyltransferase-3